MNGYDPGNLNRFVQQSLESLAAAGVEQLPKPSDYTDLAAPSAATSPTIEAETGHADKGTNEMANAESTECSSAATLEILQGEVTQCTLCEELAGTRTQTVFGVGDPNARLCFLGEAPGAQEDEQGVPFVGRAGQLLDKILEACGLAREQVYILNVLKCRPPGNRNPTPGESNNCRRFLNRQLELIDPEYICCLGAVAAQNLLDTQTAIGRLRGEVHEYRGIKVVCTYHPAYLLRNPSAKKHTWDDMKLLMREMGTPVD